MNRYASPALIATVSLFTHSVNAFDVEPYPGFRFRDYTKLTSDEKLAAAELGYTAASWNQLGDAYAENLSWWYNTNMDYYDQDGDGDYYEPNPKFLSAATKLGFTEDVWVSEVDYMCCTVRYDVSLRKMFPTQCILDSFQQFKISIFFAIKKLGRIAGSTTTDITAGKS